MNKIISILTVGTLILASCGNKNDKADAYGNFEAIETIISSQTTGTILRCNINEGDILQTGDTAYIIDTIALILQQQQVLSQRNAVSSKFSGIIAQVDVLNQQKEVLIKEQKRVLNLLKDSAATQKQLDDINGKLNILNTQIQQVKTQNQSLFEELKVFDAQTKSILNLIQKSTIINPINGTVLVKYSEQYEIAAPGKALYKIADISEIILRAYISGTQSGEIKIGQTVRVFIDASEDEYKKYPGVISWISDKAEFTPKIIQTKEERVNLVYAVKIKVKNDGSIKIGMPGEVRF
ncbi:MAG: HlyD family efflux transporter periplasmic adaptor subunit [Bacteroidales bacterium]|nr:HlyD family efflux transporter periplasmic adaptor subunit [Bacteroidales bacterium]